MDPTSICVESMLGYLQYLFDKGFAWRSIGVHRSALSSILEAHKPVPVAQHPLVCRFVRGVFNKRPPSVRVVPTWDIGQVLMYLSKDHPPADLSLFRLTAKVLFLLAAFTAKRVSDLVLFSVDSSLCHVTDECIVLQTQFGSKTDRPGHRSPPVTLRKCEEESLCPVRYVSAYKERTEPLRQASGTQQLFISPFTQRPVKLATLRRWMVKVMREAGVIASAGSTRATVTSCALLHDVPLQLLNSADWTREDTPFRHYVRVLPERTLRSISSQRSLQDAVLAQHERGWLLGLRSRWQARVSRTYLFKSAGVSALFQDPFYPAECVHTCMVVHVYAVNMAVYKGVYIHLNSCGVASFILCELGEWTVLPFRPVYSGESCDWQTVTQECKMLHSHSAEIVEFWNSNA